MQISRPVQIVPQLPQFARSEDNAAHRLLQTDSPEAQGVHAPAVQVALWEQAFPQAPQ